MKMFSSNITTNSLADLVKLISQQGKTAADYEAIKKKAIQYDQKAMWIQNGMSIQKMELLYDIYNKHGYRIRKNKNSRGFQEAINLLGLQDVSKLRHYDFIGGVAHYNVGVMRDMPWTARVLDTSRFSASAAAEENNRRVLDYIRKTVFEPYQKRAAQMVMEKYNIQDPYSIPIEERDTIQQEINQVTNDITPEEIQDYMNNKYRSPIEIEGQKVLDLVESDCELKFYTVENYKHYVIAGKQCYKTSTKRGEPILKAINPMYGTPFIKDDQFFFDEGEAFRYVDKITLDEFFTHYFSKLTPQDKQLLGNDFHKYMGTPNSLMPAVNNHLVKYMSLKDNVWTIDNETRQGQQQIANLVSMVGAEGITPGMNVNGLFERVHTEMRVNRYLYKLFRWDSKTGEVEEHYVDDKYVMNPNLGDMSLKRMIFPVIWETTRLGNHSNGVFVDTKQVDGQFIDIKDPWNPRLSYTGSYASPLMGNTMNSSLLESGLSYQIKYDILQSQIEEAEKGNIGKILLYLEQLVPDEWHTADVVQLLKSKKILSVDFEGAGITPDMLNAIRSIDLSNATEIAEKYKFAQAIKVDGISAMGANAGILGNVNPYMTSGNNETNIKNSSLQTRDLQICHLKTTERALELAMMRAPYYYQENIAKYRYAISEYTLANNEINWERIALASWNVRITTDPDDYAQIERYKDTVLKQNIAQAVLTPLELGRLVFAKSPAEILHISELIHNRLTKLEQDKQALQRELVQAQLEERKQTAKDNRDAQMSMHIDKMMTEHYKADKNATVLREGFDINRNSINDNYDREQLIQNVKKQLEDANLRLEKYLGDRELDIMEFIARNKANNDSKKAEAEIMKGKAAMKSAAKAVKS